MRVKAFTLAEVLITLGIIGIAAAMTLPTVINKYQKKQIIIQLKKAYSEINQAIRIAENKYGSIDSWDISNTAYFLDNYLSPNIKIIKTCNPSTKKCWAEKIYTIDNRNASIYTPSNYISFVTASGYSVYYWLHEKGNGGWFFVDINGAAKGPNTLGKDIHPFIFSWGTDDDGGTGRCRTKLGFFPYGLHCKDLHSRDEIKKGFETNGVQANNCLKGSNKAQAGGTCGALIMYDGWEIKDDYPW